MSVGNRVFLQRPLPAPSLINAFGQLPAANVADCMNRSCGMHPRIKQFAKGSTPIVAGPALTVKTRAGDNLIIHQALDIAQPGDILVISNEGTDQRSLMGEIMFTYAKYKKIAALIIDGPIRDVDSIATLGLPIYATGSNPAGPYKTGPGEVNVPISCGEISVAPGDVIVADCDGVIVIPLEDAPGILEAAQKFSAADAAKVTAAANGTANRAWVAKAMQDTGVSLIDGCYCGKSPQKL